MGLSECLTLLARRHLDESVNMVHIVNMVHVVTDPPRRTVEERREERIGQILDRAMEIIENEGEGALTLQRLAGSLGMVTTALYRYFSSKDALMAALQRRAIGVVQKHFQARMGAVAGGLSTTAPPTAAIVMLLSIADLYLELPRTHPDSFRFIAVLLGDPRPLLSDEEATRTAPLLEGFLRDMAALFEQAAHVGALARGSASARVIAYWSALHGAHAMEKARRISSDVPSVLEIGRFTARSLLQSWGCTPRRLGAAQRLCGEAGLGD